jgi:tRNA(Ile)-lysidine synthase
VRFSAAVLRAALESHLPTGASGIAVALSGGADSAALLTALVDLRDNPDALPLRALHIDHGLQTAAAQFRDSCRALCARLAVPLTTTTVRVDMPAGLSIEAQAREARYAALAEQLRPQECLVTAHHREDQAETLLLQALRGAGVNGLAAMPVCRVLGAGWHVRPLLDVAQGDLLEFAAVSEAEAAAGTLAATGAVGSGAGARQAGASTLDVPAGVGPPLPMADPMNSDLRFDRAYLRHKIWPALTQRWPGAASSLARSAAHMAQAQAVLNTAAAAVLGRIRDGESLSVPGLRALTPAARMNAVRLWLSEAGVDAPPQARIEEALRQVLDAAPDHLPAIVWGDAALRRYRQRLFVTPAIAPRIDVARPWDGFPQAPLDLGAGLGRLECIAQAGGIAVEALQGPISVRRRRGGETLKPAPQARTHSVQHLCQSLGVLPWMRDALPFVFSGDALIGVADLWTDARCCAAATAPGIALVWRNAPAVV